MRRILILIVVALVAFIVVRHQRIFVRDPLAGVQKNGIDQNSTRVFINYSNDVLYEDLAAGRYVLIQQPNRVPGVPVHLFCFTALACFTDDDHPPVGSLDVAPASMDARSVSFRDETGAAIAIHLR